MLNFVLRYCYSIHGIRELHVAEVIQSPRFTLSLFLYVMYELDINCCTNESESFFRKFETKWIYEKKRGKIYDYLIPASL